LNDGLINQRNSGLSAIATAGNPRNGAPIYRIARTARIQTIVGNTASCGFNLILKSIFP
jgi:hypothetical protein